jgi:pimeloyl-ACP methyl ester carboxylesterase/DNA-binding CsgD family transcriptional regulator
VALDLSVSSVGETLVDLTPAKPAASQSSVAQALAASFASGFLAAGIVDQWVAMDDKTSPDAKLLAHLVTQAAEVELKLAASAAVGAASLGVAFLDRTGHVRWTDPRFREWIGDPASSVGCLRLVREVSSAPVIGLVQTERFGVLSVFAAGGDELARWQDLAELVWGYRGSATFVLVVFAPSRAAELIADAAQAYGLTAAESRLLLALLEAPNLETAAQQVGINRDAAKEMMKHACRKAGVRTTAELVGRVIDLSCGAASPPAVSAADFQTALGVSPTEARVAQALAQGRTAKEAASTLNLTTQTVATYRRSIFDKSGVNRARDLRRLMSELNELQRLANASEIVVNRRDVREQLKILVTDQGRQIAYVDYGAGQGGDGGHLVILGHGYTTGRLAPPPLLAHLHAAGAHVITVQRPGFGLTTPAEPNVYLATAASDLAALVRAMGCRVVDFIVRDGGIGCATETVRRYPGLLRNVVLVNPRRPSSATAHAANPFSVMTRWLAANPLLIEPFSEMLRRQSRSDVMLRILRSVSRHVDSDRQCLEQPGVADYLIRDSQGMNARSMAGFVAEQRLFAQGWEIPPGLESACWNLVNGDGLWPLEARVWEPLPGITTIRAPAGWLVQFTHPHLIADLVRIEAGMPPVKTAAPGR